MGNALDIMSSGIRTKCENEKCGFVPPTYSTIHRTLDYCVRCKNSYCKSSCYKNHRCVLYVPFQEKCGVCERIIDNYEEYKMCSRCKEGVCQNCDVKNKGFLNYISNSTMVDDESICTKCNRELNNREDQVNAAANYVLLVK